MGKIPPQFLKNPPKSWRKTNKPKKQSSGKRRTITAKKQSRTRRAGSMANRIYGKMERAVGASRIAERLMNIVGFPPEPYKSTIATGVGFARGGLEGGLGAAIFSSNFPEMLTGAIGGFGGNGGIGQGEAL